MPWVARAIPMLLRVIGRGGRISARHGIEGVGKQLPQITQKARRASGWSRGLLSAFADVVGSIAASLSIATVLNWGGVKGDAAEAAKRRCEEAADKCKNQDHHAADGADSVGECGKKVEDVLEDCECQIETMAQRADDILARCEAFVEDSELGPEAAKVAQEVCCRLAQCAEQLYDARNSCVEQCLDQAATDVERSIVTAPVAPPTIVADASGAVIASASTTASVSRCGGGVAAQQESQVPAMSSPYSALASAAPPLPQAPLPVTAPEACLRGANGDSVGIDAAGVSSAGVSSATVAAGNLDAGLAASINAGVSAGLSVGIAVGAAGAASVAGIVGAAEGLASSLLDLEGKLDIELQCGSADSSAEPCAVEPQPVPAPESCEPIPEPEPVPETCESSPEQPAPSPPEPESESEPEPTPEPVPEPPPPAEKLRHLGIEVPTASAEPVESTPAQTESEVTVKAEPAPANQMSSPNPPEVESGGQAAPSTQQSAPGPSVPLSGIGAGAGVGVSSPSAGEW